MKSLLKIHVLVVCLLLCLYSPLRLSAQTTAQAGLRGTVTDPSGARIPDALVQIVGPGGQLRKTTDAVGQYSFTALTPGEYLVRIIAKGFTLEERPKVNVAAGTLLDIELKIEAAGQVVDVESEASKITVSVDPTANSDALVIGKNELASLSDDPDELAQQLQALAGPGAGPAGGQIYTDGFAGSAPPKSSIREIRINSNPFSSEYDQPGFGRIEILTKPGGDTLHGQFSNQFNDQNLNARSALFTQSAPAKTSLPPYKNLLWGASIGGPIKKDKASFTFDFNRRDITENAFIIATTLDSSLNPNPVNQAVLVPQVFTSWAPRVDVAINDRHTLIVRYQENRNELDNLGVGNFSLPEVGYNQNSVGRTLQVTETALLKPVLVNETRFQFSRNTNHSLVSGTAPSITVQDGFTSGSARVGNSSNITNRWEINNLSILSHKTHTIKWGGRLRHSQIADTALNNFNGSFTFFGGSGPALDGNNQPIPGTSVDLTGLQVYQRTLILQRMGIAPAQIRAEGGGASLFSLGAGIPLTRVTQTDIGLFLNDDWKIRPNLTLSTGLRYEAQTNLGDHKDWSPRLSIAWGVDAKGTKPAKTVLRGGFGVFYNRIGEFTTLNAIRYNGITQQSYLLQNPDFYPNIPTPASLASGLQPQNIQVVSPTLRAPAVYGTNVGVDRQVNKWLRFSSNYFNIRGLHMIRTRDINALLPGSGLFPFGDSTVRMMTESSGKMQQQQFNIQPTVTYKKLSLFGSYGIFHAKDDFEGLAADPYNLNAEWDPGFGDVRHRLTLGPTFPLPFKIIANTLFIYNSAAAYTITTGLQDPSGDGSAVQRPALVNLSAAACTGGTLKYTAQFGCFDLSPAYGTATIPRNYARGPNNVNMQLRLSRTWGFIKKEGPGAPAMLAQGPGGLPPGAPVPMKYNMTFSVAAINPLNHPNFANPNGNLLSSYFGKPLSLQGTFGPGNGTYNRKVTAQLLLSF